MKRSSSSTFARGRAYRRARRGAATGGTICALAVAGTIATTAVVVTPRYLRAASTELPPQPASDEHRQTLDLIAGLIGRSREVLAVHPRTSSPYAEIVLWLEDAEDRGAIGLDEVAVLSHSRALHAITFLGGEPIDPEADDHELAIFDAPGSDIGSAAFCAAWRQRPDLQPRRIATGVSDLRVEVLEGRRPGRRMLRISLTWTSETSDAPDEASVLVDVAMRHADDARSPE